MGEDDRKGIAKRILRVSEAIGAERTERLLNLVNSGEGAGEDTLSPLLERLGPILEAADRLGEIDPEFDVKAYLDEMWGDI